MKFLGFSKSGDKIQKYFSSKKKKFFFGNIFERDFFPDFGENFMISFFHPLNFNGVVLGENLSSLSKGLSEKSLFLNLICDEITPSKTFPAIYFQTSPNQSQINHNPINRFH